MNTKLYLSWLLGAVVSGGLWFLLTDDATLVSSLIFGGIVGLVGVRIYLLQHRQR